MTYISNRNQIGIYGLGRVGGSLAFQFAQMQKPVLGFGRTEHHVATLCRQLHIQQGSQQDYSTLAVLFLCVSDDAVATVSMQIAAQSESWEGCLVAHTSGRLTSEVLSAFERKGATVISFHPLQTFSEDRSADRFKDIYVGIEGSETAIQQGIQYVRELGAKYLVLPREAKVRYHLAASIASNFFVTLVALSQEVLYSIGIPPTMAFDLLKPLMDGTWQNLQSHVPEEALTGAIVRGDITTLKEHLSALETQLPHLQPIYHALAAETVRVAVRSERLSETQAWKLLDELV